MKDLFDFLLAPAQRTPWRVVIPVTQPLGSRMGVVAAALVIATACGGGAPTAPNGSSAGSGLALTCSAPTILAGDLLICRATAAAADVSTAAIWTSSDPNIATSQAIGLFMGKLEGQATVSATYGGQTVSKVVTVHLQDVLRATASASQGTFKAGTTATLWLQGFYGVASADSGTLTLVITDQSGTTVSASAPLTVPHGGDRYLISTTFNLAPGTTRVCRTGVLQVRSTTLTVVPDVSLVPCFDVTQ
jgi:hypothetical protein